MRITVLASGKLREKELRHICDDYFGRIERYARVREIETKDAESLVQACPPSDVLVALEVWGKALTSEQFSARLETWSQQGKGEITFIIGGADGIPAELSRRAHFHLSLSSMTLPHRLARIVLVEQIYRGFSILRGEPYAREG
jgi:23S rRNA (pseudouridine1915-N3)-methyltransferase